MSNEREAVKEFTKRPVTISAIQWTGDNLRAVITFIEDAVVTNDLASAARWDDYRDLVEKRGLVIKTLEGQHIASVGDWIIKGVKGEHYPCKPDIFEMTYAPAQQSTPAGYVMVPVKPTPEMLDCIMDWQKIGNVTAYRAMLAAAPSQQQSDAVMVPTEAVEVVATVTVSFDEGDEGSAIELCELHTLLDEGVTDLMTVAQHKRLMANHSADDLNMVKVPRELLDRFPEINMANFGADEVNLLNNWGIEVALLGGDHE